MHATKTTIHLSLPRAARWLDQIPPALIAVFAILAIAASTAAFGRWRATQATQTTAAQPTLAPIVIIATPRAEVMPTPAAQAAALLPHTLHSAVVAYDAPAGNVIGAIEQGRGYTLLARYGVDWLQADVQGSGVVWLRAAEVLDMPAGLADMQPPPAPVVVERPVYVSAPAYRAANEPPAATAPETSYEITSAPPSSDSPAAPAAAPAPAAPATAATPSLQDALAATRASTQAAAERGMTQWQIEHCFGDQCVP